jgi:uncharacterized protein (UPF0179 family)
MVSHANLTSNIALFDRLFVQVVEVEQTPIRQILDQGKMACVGSIVPNVELVVVHLQNPCSTLEKDTGRWGLDTLR